MEEAYFDEQASALICSASFVDCMSFQNYCAHVAASLSHYGVDGAACGCAFAGGGSSVVVVAAAAGCRLSCTQLEEFEQDGGGRGPQVVAKLQSAVLR